MTDPKAVREEIEALNQLAMRLPTDAFIELHTIALRLAEQVESLTLEHHRAHPVCKQLYEDYTAMKEQVERLKADRKLALQDSIGNAADREAMRQERDEARRERDGIQATLDDIREHIRIYGVYKP